MRDHLLVAPEMSVWISMVRIRQISTEHWALSPVDELPDAVRTPKHAAVGVNTQDNHVFDATLLKEREQLLSTVGDGVDRRDLDRLDLMRPRVRWSARSEEHTSELQSQSN